MKRTFFATLLSFFFLSSFAKAESYADQTALRDVVVTKVCKCIWEGGLTSPEELWLIQFIVYGEGRTKQARLGQYSKMSACVDAIASSPECQGIFIP